MVDYYKLLTLFITFTHSLQPVINNSDGTTTPVLLQWVEIPVVTLAECWAQLRAANTSTEMASTEMELTNGQICAGFDEGGKGSIIPFKNTLYEILID